MVSPFAEAFASLTGAHSLAPSVVMTTTPSDVVAVSNPLAFPGSNLNNALYLGGRSSVNSRTHQLPGLGFLGPLSPLAGRNSLCNAASLPNLASLAGLNSAPGDLMFPNMALVESLANNAFLMGAQFPMTSSNDANSESKPGSSASPTAMGPKLPSAAKTPPAEDLRIDQRGLVPEEGEPAPRQATESFTLSHGESRREWGSHLARQSNGQDPGAKNQHGPFQATRERDEDELVSGTLDLSVMSRGSRESSSKRQDSVFSGTAEQRYVIEGSTGSGAQTVGEDQEEDRQLREESASPEMFAKPGQCLLNEISRRDLNLLKVSRANLYDFPTQVPPVLPATYAREPVSPWVVVRERFGAGLLNLVVSMMTSSNGSSFRVTGPLCGEPTGYWWIPLTKASDAELWYFLWSVPE